MKKIGILVGSLRQDSFTKKVAKNVLPLFPDDIETDWIEIGELPLYNQDVESQTELPDEIVEFREKAREKDGFVFFTPEYNRSVPGVLKNALDVGSRPKATSVWNDKPAGIISVAPGNLSAFGANHHLRQSLVFFNMPVVQQPEVYLGNIASLLNENDKIEDKGTMDFLQSFVDAYITLLQK